MIRQPYRFLVHIGTLILWLSASLYALSPAVAYENREYDKAFKLIVDNPKLCDISAVKAPDWATITDLGEGVFRVRGTPSEEFRGPNYFFIQSDVLATSQTHHLMVTVKSEFHHWLSEDHGISEIDGESNDDDDDHIPVILEYVLDLDPAEQNQIAATKATSEVGTVGFEFLRRPGLDDVRLVPEWTTNLNGPWRRDGLIEINCVKDGELERVCCHVSEANRPDGPIFYRLSVELETDDGTSAGLPADFVIDASQSTSVSILVPVPSEDRIGWTFEMKSPHEQGVVSDFDSQTGAMIYTPPVDSNNVTVVLEYVAISPTGERFEGDVTLLLTEEVIVSVPTEIYGLPSDVPVEVTLSGQGYLLTESRIGNGVVGFHDVGLVPGQYFLKASAPNNDFGATHQLWIDVDGAVDISKESGINGDGAIILIAQSLDGYAFRFHWEEDVSVSGSEYVAYVNEPPVISFPGEVIEKVNFAAAQQLQEEYNIILDNELKPWTQEHASRLLKTIATIPTTRIREYRFPNNLSPVIWKLTDDHLPEDIVIDNSGGTKIVTISSHAFVNANRKIAEIDGRRGIWYSKRLHRGLVRYVTDFGQSSQAVNYILQQRFNVSVNIQDYSILTAGTTNETAANFQAFSPDELLLIVDMFEEMPTGFHRIPELQYLVRRVRGHPHPTHPQAPAVAWVQAGYVEFMDTAFTAPIESVHRLLVHEKSHFIWDSVLSQQTRDDWVSLGQWWQDEFGDWHTDSTTEFVSAYAHLKNPEEDFAESIAYFMLNPDKLKSRSLPKYEFIRDRIMQGNYYLSLIREDLTFEVFNLYPDYVYPGKVRQVDIRVTGELEADKSVHFEIELAKIDGIYDNARYVYFRLFSEIGTYLDIHLRAAGNTDEGFLFYGSVQISKFAKSGYWTPEQIRIRDNVGNDRYEDITHFGWLLYIDNPLQDLAPPSFVADSHALSVTQDVVDGHETHWVTATWQFNDDSLMGNESKVFGRITTPGTNQRIDEYGTFEFIGQAEDGLYLYSASVTFLVTEYHPSGDYEFRYVFIEDAASNKTSINFTEGNLEYELRTIDVVTANPDTSAPELNLNTISIEATPVTPSNPDGETIVTLSYEVRDDLSGLGVVSLNLRDPQGVEHFYYHTHSNFYSDYFVGDPTDWATYEMTIILPKGSAPGTWGLSSIMLKDKALNMIPHSFTEVVHFDVIE